MPRIELPLWARSYETKRLIVWVAFATCIVLLRSLYAVAVGTFVLTFLGNRAVDAAQLGHDRLHKFLNLPEKLKLPRKVIAFLYMVALITGIATVTVVVVPGVIQQGQYLVKVIESDDPYLLVSRTLTHSFGSDVTNKLVPFLKSVSSFDTPSENGLNVLKSGRSWASSAGEVELAAALQKILKENAMSLVKFCSKLYQLSTSFLYKFFVSLLFSFFLILDLPNIKKSVRSLRNSKLAFPYSVLAPDVSGFAEVVGDATVIQIQIAAVNTVLTMLGLIFLKIPAVGVLSLIVFICSFIPAIGILLSTLPMLVIALNEYGMQKLISVFFMIFWVHAVEAYLLYPRLYASSFKIPTLLVITVLYMTEHLVGLQGLFLALPVTAYAMGFLKTKNKKTDCHVSPFSS
eukprot:CAMPEP_0185763228 /NCGR_PEP_ID=MMETSP1174-20130828/22179_1 /TAXON_ID=35687 /ORGANISM="Dictyocha speculum, Strain CCMP1381" /LENGTH=402 /DNA_ID=CAMNT_0028445249 /DNA_START=125 /DNA_END=1333 /DNA_ORIENTATION=+